MHKVIIETYPKTEEAVLVDKWLGNDIINHLMAIVIANNSYQVLAVAKKLEKEDSDKCKN